jgi:hypothetical protein
VKVAILLLIVAAAIAVVWALTREGRTGEVHLLTVPGTGSRAEPGLTLGRDGHLYLTWVEERGDEHALRFSRWRGQWREGEPSAWSEPRDIAQGADWFVNWADVPALAALEDGTLFAHWLAKVGEGTYAYGVHVSISRDAGATWSAPIVPHRDSTQTEHGFVSWVPADSDHMGLVWLDGREMTGTAGDHGEGSMGLRYTTVDREGNLGEEVLLDGRVCECCATAAAVPEPGALLVVYRDRTLEEVRDIAFVRSAVGAWSPPRPVHRDGWRIEGCPVNGPAIDAAGGRTAVAWFTMSPADSGAVQVAFSDDGGRTFGPALRVDDGNPLGRVDVVVQENGVSLVSWLEETADGGAEIRWREIPREGAPGPAHLVTATSSERASGFPRMERLGDRVYFAWTEAGDEPTVRTGVIRK